MRRRLVLLTVVVLSLFVNPLQGMSKYMDCYPGKWMVAPKAEDSRCIIDHDESCMICIVTVSLP
jgi:hypothetical protein